MTEQNLVFEYPPGTQGLAPDGMSGMTPVHPAGLLQDDGRVSEPALTFVPHGNPFGDRMDLRPVSGGGASCD